MRVQEVMSRDVVTVTPETPLKEVARKLIELRISGMPVVGPGGSVVGVVSEADVLAKERIEYEDGGAIARLIHRPDPAQKAKLAARVAGEAMTSPAITVEPYWTVPTVAQMMLEHGINRLPVVRRGRLVGIVTRADLVRAFVRTDEELAKTIRDEVLLRIMWLDPAGFEVRVAQGVASIRGHAERRSTAEAIETAVAMVPGIVGVNADITWTLEEAEIRPVTVDAFFPHSPR